MIEEILGIEVIEKDDSEYKSLNGIIGYYDKNDNFCFRIPLLDRAYEDCLAFAKAVYQTNQEEYERRGQSNKWLIIQQIADGKLAEFAVWKYMKSFGYQLSMPDCNIYDEVEKSYEADLYYGIYDIHVKSISVENARKYGQSYLFQRSDPITMGGSQERGVLAFTLGISSNEVWFYGFYPIPLLNGILKNPRLEEMQKTKLALYFEDLSLDQLHFFLEGLGPIDNS